MRLSELLRALPEPPISVSPNDDPEITVVAHHTQRVVPGALFVAVYHRGYSVDRHEFVGQAVEAGAAAIVVSRPVDVPPRVAIVTVRNTAAAFGWLSAQRHGMPSHRLGVVGVTGTDGKTTTCTLTAAVLDAAGFGTGMATTVASKSTGPAVPNPHHTSTPEADEIQALLARTVAEGGTRAVLEATSHALDQDRLAGTEVDVAVVTRVTHEHMEYHGTPEQYLAAKARLLDLLLPNPRTPKAERVDKAAVLNADDDNSFPRFAPRSPAPVLSYGLGPAAALRAVDVHRRQWGTEFRVVSPWGEARLELRMPGEFNVYNALAAVGAGCTLGAPFHVALDALAVQKGVRGRMERIDSGQPYTVVVDFAHTPDSLERALKLLRSQTAGRVFVVFGSAGERDVPKRAWMGRIAAKLADLSIFADEDPRREPSEKILDDIAAGAVEVGAREGEQFLKIADRREAIAEALRRARAGDTVLLAGKGHERSIIGQRDGQLYTFPWDEHAVARELLSELGFGGRG
ncbi:MAG TPA: UDP-N-acetylmuramoyl-L-alanyl-D-glutamate--2,6-diaminopimelate ligase [Chloroflexota bacterium]|nr:UDP-N-acetylmuramoyl-L-alanyl-D-glutamate--2,6-diaminopimelate ligase [Chloroflexota bacterium]